MVLSWCVPGGSDCMVLVRKCVENVVNYVVMGYSGVSWCGGFWDWLFYVELWCDVGGCWNAGYYE